MSKPVITLLDIETKPILADVWDIWQQNVGLNQIKSDWTILSYAAKRYQEKEVQYNDTSKQDDIENDIELLKDLHKIIDESDFIIAHNGRKFDMPKIFARFIINGIEPPSPAVVIDTLDICKKNFKFTSNKLEYVSSVLCPKKKKMSHNRFPGHMLWKMCMKGDEKAWAEMKKYNIMDVISLEAVYDKLRPFHKNHPNMAVFSDDLSKPTCKCCGSHKVSKRGVTHTQVGVYQRYKCNSCGTWSRGSQLLNSKTDRENILR